MAGLETKLEKNFQQLTTVILHEVKLENDFIPKIDLPMIKHFRMKVAVESFPMTYQYSRNSAGDLQDKIDTLTKNSGIEGFNPFVKSFPNIPHVEILLNGLILFKKTETQFIGCCLYRDFMHKNFHLMDFKKLKTLALLNCGSVHFPQVNFIFRITTYS